MSLDLTRLRSAVERVLSENADLRSQVNNLTNRISDLEKQQTGTSDQSDIDSLTSTIETRDPAHTDVTQTGGAGTDAVTGGAGVETLSGGLGADTLPGGVHEAI